MKATQSPAAHQLKPKQIRAVDLFCGCGGLSLGFDVFKGNLSFQTVLGIDIDAAALRCYNSNHPQANAWSLGRLCDITWFGNADEALLYYLVHFAYAHLDIPLQEDLDALGFRKFIGQLRRLDVTFQEKAGDLFESTEYIQSIDVIDRDSFKTGICKAFLDRLGIGTLSKIDNLLSSTGLPWQQEYTLLDIPVLSPDSTAESILKEEHHAAAAIWSSEVGKLKDAAKKTGNGQQSVVPKRVRSLVAFLSSAQGKRFQAIWSEWCAGRQAVRRSFLASNAKDVSALYTADRRVHVILGGPPCKGFSRIGRPVMARLREQGSYSWASSEFGDERNALLYRYVLFLEALRPNVFIFENVRNFESVLKTPSGTLDAPALLAEAIENLSNTKLHYKVVSRVITASDFGIPQNRQRYIMAGFNEAMTPAGTADRFFGFEASRTTVPLAAALSGLAAPLEFVPGGAQCRTSDCVAAYTLIDERMPLAEKQYMKWVRQPYPGRHISPASTDAHVARRLRADDKGLLEKFAPGQRWMDYKLRRSQTYSELRSVFAEVRKYVKKNKVAGSEVLEKKLSALSDKFDDSLLLRLLIEECDLPEGMTNHLLEDAYLGRGHNVHGDWFERLDAGRPCKTIVAHIGKDTYGYFHPYEARGLSIREAARVQSFPDWFNFGAAGVVEGYSMIGNAVPPLLAHKFAERLAYLDEADGLFGVSGRTLPSGQSSNQSQSKLLLNKVQ